MPNTVSLSGKISSSPTLVPTARKQQSTIYEFTIDTERLSGKIDKNIIHVNSESIPIEELTISREIAVTGTYCSHNDSTNGHNKLCLYIMAKTIDFDVSDITTNTISIVGTLCKDPSIRETPYGRTITDLLIAVTRPNKTISDYIPCIAWGSTAIAAAKLKTGNGIVVKGRCQSRDYVKKINDIPENRIAYEISALNIIPDPEYDAMPKSK